MVKDNPFMISFGMEPSQYIDRFAQTDEIIENFTAESMSNCVYMISGVRGAGKTVMLSYLSKIFAEKKEWIVINVSADTDIISKTVAKLYSIPSLKKLFIKAKIDISIFGLGVAIEDGNQIFDMDIALEKMLAELNKNKKRVLITIDEVVKNEYVKIFVSSFQILIRQKLPVYLLMTGLYENIYNLQNEKSLTFLYRAPKILLEPLSLNSIAKSYKRIFGTTDEVAMYMAKLTKGYPFAYQVLGYLCWRTSEDVIDRNVIDGVIPHYDDYLENYAYEKIWFELSEKEKEIAAILAKEGMVKIADIRRELSLSSGSMSVYRDRLNKKGILDISQYGYLSLKLPRFGEIIKIWL